MLDVIASTSTIVNPQLTSGVHDVLYSLLQLAAIGLTTGATWAIKLWINSMNSGWKQTIAARLVKYAQQRIPSNGEKLRYVSEKLHDHFPRLSVEEISHLLEESVSDLKTGAL